MEKYLFNPSKIINADETGVMCLQQPDKGYVSQRDKAGGQIDIWGEGKT